MADSITTSELDRLLDDLVNRVAGAQRAVVLSADGLPVGWSQDLPVGEAEHLSAVVSGFQSLARGTARHLGGGNVRQTVVEMDNAFLVFTAAGQGRCLALITASNADIGTAAYEMNLLVQKMAS
ncbi:roadblock/LC7 domain-containing protein, partial [Amycolatopsis taiwanensis]|uniref:Dynein regulation protein LC7 n=1 Tax=Amycolatopsis taiwanensis TaxID=342230 RepID=A0A9W6QUX2_9PSEU